MPTSTKLSVNQRGSILPYLLVVLVLGGGFLGFKYLKSNNAQITPLLSIPNPTPSVKIYSDKDLGFEFEYPSNGFEVIQSDEAGYFNLSKTDHRKNFTGYVGYQPPAFVSGLMLKKPDTQIESQYDSVPLTLWVFDNPDKLTIDAWFDKYWYYPFVWGIFAQPGKGHIQPTGEATISGRLAKLREVSYQPGKPEFMYVANEEKMFMFRLIRGVDGKVIPQFLQSFKFTK